MDAGAAVTSGSQLANQWPVAAAVVFVGAFVAWAVNRVIQADREKERELFQASYEAQRQVFQASLASMGEQHRRDSEEIARAVREGLDTVRNEMEQQRTFNASLVDRLLIAQGLPNNPDR